MLSVDWIKNISVVLLLLLFIGMVFLAYSWGDLKAKAKLVSVQQQQVFNALENFKKDQDRYPTPVEFENPEVMGSYLQNFPIKQFQAGDCMSSFEYVSRKVSEATLSVCLPRSVGEQAAGVSVFNSPFRVAQ